MKKLFGTPKRAMISVICIVVVIAAVSVIAVKGTLITKAQAQAVALRDAGLSEAEASALRTKLEFDDGHFQYEVDFYNNGTAQTQGISLDEAKAAALGDAGLPESDVTFKKAKLDRENGIQVYDIKFYTVDTEYDYEINASDGAVLEKSVESFRVQANTSDGGGNSSGDNYIGVDRAKEIALSHANLNEADVMFKKAKLENDDGGVEYEIEFYFGRTEYEYTIDAVSGNIIEYDVDYD